MGANHGDVFEIEVVKNAGGFNDWVSAKKSDGSTPSATTQSSVSGTASSGASKGYTASPKSSYPTDEERAKTQVYIVRQSNITAAINLLSVGAKAPPKLDDIIATAKRFEDHVFGTSNDPISDAAPAVSAGNDMDDDIPF